MHAIILAGGFGTRLRSVVSDVPKPLAPIDGRPFLAWLCDALIQQGVTAITLSVHHEWEKIRDYFNAHPLTVPLDYAVEDKPLGTGGAMAFAMKEAKISQPVLVLNGDTFVTVDYQALYQQHITQHAVMSMVLRAVPDTGRYGDIAVSNGVVTSFNPGTPGKAGLINAGVYVLSPSVFDGHEMPEAFSFEVDFMQQKVQALKPGAFIAEDYFIDIGIPADYSRACHELPEIIIKNSHAYSA
jgi:D-glycero-alpha-D-manno-heptose 1-phosphate guanylyltransferase